MAKFIRYKPKITDISQNLRTLQSKKKREKMLLERSDLNARCEESSGAMELEGLGPLPNRSKGKNAPADRFIPSFVKKSVYDTFENEENIISDSKKNQFGSILKNRMFFDQQKQDEFEHFEKTGNGDQISRKLFYFAQTEQKNSNLEIIETEFAEKT